MNIIRVLNTNAVVTLDGKGQEIIATGAGIGFKKKKGDNLDQALGDKTYYLQNKKESHRLQEVVKEISEQYLEIAGRVVEAAKIEGLRIRDALYITLTDHINRENFLEYFVVRFFYIDVGENKNKTMR